MENIRIKVRELGSRGNNIQRSLRRISRIRGGPAWYPRSSSRDLIIATYDGTQPTSDYRQWRFSTFVPRFKAMYFERWMRTADNEEYWYLDRAYLSIFHLFDRNDEREFICLHSDPNADDEKKMYKKGPHLHIIAAQDPLPHAHFALNLGHLEDVLTSIDTLSDAIDIALNMLKEEVLDNLLRSTWLAKA